MGIFGNLTNKDQQEAARQGKSTSAIATDVLPPDIDMGELGRVAREEVKAIGHVDQHESKPVGIIDAALAMLFAVKEDRKGRSFREFDGIDSDDDKQFIAQLMHRRYDEKDRRLTSAQVQRVRDICEKCDMKWPHDMRSFLRVHGPHKEHRDL